MASPRPANRGQQRIAARLIARSRQRVRKEEGEFTLRAGTQRNPPASRLPLDDHVIDLAGRDVARPRLRRLMGLQLQLRRQLEGERYGQEQFRYFNSLRTRWVTEDLATMKARLVQFTLDRYWR